MNQAKRLKELRETHNLSLRELSEKTGISKSALSDLELDKRTGTVDVLKTLALFYNVSLDYITCNPVNSMIDDMIQVLVEQKIIVPGEPIDKETQDMLIKIIETSLNKQRNQSN